MSSKKNIAEKMPLLISCTLKLKDVSPDLCLHLSVCLSIYIDIYFFYYFKTRLFCLAACLYRNTLCGTNWRQTQRPTWLCLRNVGIKVCITIPSSHIFILNYVFLVKKKIFQWGFMALQDISSHKQLFKNEWKKISRIWEMIWTPGI